MARLRGEASVVATAILLAATLALGISLIVYAHRTSHVDVHAYSCIPSMLKVDNGILVYNSCSYEAHVKIVPSHLYNVTIGNTTMALNSFVLKPGEAAYIRGTPKAIIANGYLVPVQR